MRLTRFSGLMPSISARHLPQGHGTVAQNTRTTDGSLRAMREPKLIGPCVGEYTLTPSATYDCIPPCTVLPVSGTNFNRIQVLNGSLAYMDGTPVVPAAPTAPTFVGTAPDGDLPTGFRVTRIDDRGGESEPSPLLAGKVDADSTVKLLVPGRVNLYALVIGQTDGRINAEGNPAASWALVGEFTDSAVFKFNSNSWELSTDTLIDESCTPRGLTCITRDEAGFTYAWGTSEVWISDKNSSTIWPTRGHVTIEYDIIHAVAVTDALLVLTNGVPFLIRPTLSTDGSLHPTTIPYTAHHPVVGGVPNISQTSTGIVYATRMGLIGLTANAPSGYQLITRGVVNEEEWRSKWFPKVVGTHQGEVVSDTWVYDYADTNHGRNDTSIFHTHTFPMEKLQSLPDGRLIGYKEKQAYEWGGGDFAAAVYESEINVEQGKRVFTAAKLVGANIGGVRFELIDADTNVVIASKMFSAADSGKPFRMPARRRIHYKIRLSLPRSKTEIIIYEVHIGADINDLVRAEGDNA